MQQHCLASADGGHHAALLPTVMHLQLLLLTADLTTALTADLAAALTAALTAALAAALTAALAAALRSGFVVDRCECRQPTDLAAAAAVGPCHETSASCSLHSAAHAGHVTL